VNAWVLPVWTLLERELVRFFRQPNRVIGAFGSPVVFWILIGGGMTASFRPAAMPDSMSALEYLYPGTLVLIVLFTSVFSTISIIEDRREGFLQSVLVAPVARGAMVLGKVLGGTVVAFLQATVFLLLSPFLGISWSWGAMALALGVVFVLAFSLTALGFLIAWHMDSTQGFHAIMNLCLIPMWVLSGAFFPLAGAPGWLAWLMHLNPLTYGVAALRWALPWERGAETWGMPAFGWCLGVTAMAAAGFYLAAAACVGQRWKRRTADGGRTGAAV
jgi:ABC-2 type transport system permease protein